MSIRVLIKRCRIVTEDLKKPYLAILLYHGCTILPGAIVKEAVKIAIVLQNPLFLPLSKLVQTPLNQQPYGAIWKIIQ